MSKRKTLSAVKGKGSKMELAPTESLKTMEEFAAEDWHQHLQPKALAFRHSLASNARDTIGLLDMTNPKTLLPHVIQKLGLAAPESSMRDNAIAGLYMRAIAHARRFHFTPVAASALVEVVGQLLARVEGSATQDAQVDFLKDILTTHGRVAAWVPGSPMYDFHGQPILTAATDFLSESFVLHHRLYENFFRTPATVSEARISTTKVLAPLESVARVAPLAQALTASEVRDHLKAQKMTGGLGGVLPQELNPFQAKRIIQQVIADFTEQQQQQQHQQQQQQTQPTRLHHGVRSATQTPNLA